MIAHATIAAALLAGGFLARAMVDPRSSLFGRVRWRLPCAAIALTFDDGPWPGSTDRILDILATRRVSATFFVIGRNALRWPHLVERAHREGHLIANHTMDHHWWCSMRRDAYWHRQIGQAQDAIRAILHLEPALFRPPMGHKTLHTARAARAHGLHTITWTRRAFDGVDSSTDDILAQLFRAREADILALHDGAPPGAPRKPAPTAEALPAALDMLQDRGLAFERLDTALAIPGYRVSDLTHAQGARTSSPA